MNFRHFMDELVWIDIYFGIIIRWLIERLFMIDTLGFILNKEEKGNGDYRPE